MSLVAMQTTLKLRGTFLEVQYGMELMNCQMPRSVSQPCLHSASSEGEEAEFGLANSYVKNLSDKLSCLSNDVCCARMFFEDIAKGFDKGANSLDDLCSPVDNHSCSWLRNISSDTALDTQQGMNVEAVDVALQLTQAAIQNVSHNFVAQEDPEGAATKSTINISVATMLLKVKAGAWQEEYFVKDSTGCPSVCPFSWADLSEDFDDAIAVPPAGCSRGSIGHPDLCNRPCLYFVTGTCANGSDCNFCHLAHPERSVHMDKRQREMLRRMSPQEWASLVLPIVRQRIEAVEKSPESQAMLADIAARCGIPIGSMPAATPHRSLRLLVLTLRSMSLKALLSAMQRGLSQYGQQVEDMLEALLQHLRRLASEDVPLMQLVVR
mmetsp:Transcript_76205/g.214539  ORF Transcript_76205/g.214539 Transcript_76205/m.214539 type:complete len:380 (+) Transcript_76205:128-1267(+)